MKKSVFVFLFLASSIAAPTMEGTGRIYMAPARVGLVLIGSTPEGFVLMVDGSSLNADGRISQEQKLFPVGHQAAVAIFGAISLQDPLGGTVRAELNIGRITEAWLKAHPEADLQTADRALDREITDAINRFFSTRDPGAARGAFKLGIALAGFAEGKRVVNTTRYFLPAAKGSQVRAERTSTLVRDSDVWVFGNSTRAREMLSRAMQKRGSEYPVLFREAMNLAENPESRKREGRRSIVAPPNRFATITAKEGFVWQNE